MSGKIPYLQRRGDGFSFRIVHPDDFQAMTGKREFTKTLETTDKSVAIPKILMLAVELSYGNKLGLK
ncbi:MAG TPA: DUF6538 domain-containing protein [Nitrosospira sp.]|nr:DUF6538 domain-containing protein [Nitrosospira sp.]